MIPGREFGHSAPPRIGGHTRTGKNEVRRTLTHRLQKGWREGRVDAKTARQYIAVAEGCGLKRQAGIAELTGELFGRTLLELEGGEIIGACPGCSE
jgi:hypothetical protein